MKTALALAGSLFSLLAGVVHAQDSEPPATRNLAGELIVKFEDSTPAAEALGATARGNPAEDPLLTGYVDELGKALSLPLAVDRVTSGAEVLLVIDVRALVEDALKRTRQLEGIAEARALPKPEGGGAVQPAAVYEVSFVSGSEAAAALQRANAAEASTDEQLDEIVDGLSQQLGLPLLYRIEDGDELQLTIDLSAVAESAAARLREMPGVRYVELNQLFEPMI